MTEVMAALFLVALATLVLFAAFGGSVLVGLVRWLQAQVRGPLPRLPSDVGLRESALGTLWIELDGADGAIAIRPREGGRGAEPTDWHSETLGDAEFDRRCVAEGDPVVLRALLDEPARTAVTALIAAGGRVEAGLVAVPLGETKPEAVAVRVAILRAALARVGPMDDREIRGRLVHVASMERSEIVRRLAFGALVARYPAQAAAIAPTLLGVADPLLRATAAAHAGEAGADVLHALRTHPDPRTRAAAVGGIARLPGAIPILARHVAEVGDPLVVAEALAGTRDPAAEPILIAFLEWASGILEWASASVELQRGLSLAAKTLAEIGTAAAVPALRRHAGPEFVQAILAIRSRIGPGAAGRVAVAAGGGEVSVAAGGGLALATSERAPE